MLVQIILLLLSIIAITPAQHLPDYIMPCYKSDPNLDKCIESGIRQVSTHFGPGIPELNVPPVEPFLVRRVQIENNAGQIRIKAAFTNMTIYGLSNHTISSVKSNWQQHKLDISGKIPKISANGYYEVTGAVLLLNIKSRGEFSATIEDAAGVVSLQGSEQLNAKNLEYLRIDNIRMDFKVGKAKFEINETTRNKIFGEALSNFLNQNWKILLQELKPTISSVMGRYVKEFVNPVFEQIPLSAWLREGEPVASAVAA